MAATAAESVTVTVLTVGAVPVPSATVNAEVGGGELPFSASLQVSVSVARSTAAAVTVGRTPSTWWPAAAATAA